MIIEGIHVFAQEGISENQLYDIVIEEKAAWQRKKKELAKIECSLDGDEIVVKTTELSPITRTRRITGYLSTIDRFNDAKAAELNDRVAHL